MAVIKFTTIVVALLGLLNVNVNGQAPPPAIGITMVVALSSLLNVNGQAPPPAIGVTMVAALSSLLNVNGQVTPTTTDIGGTDLSSTVEGGSVDPNYYIDSFVFSSSAISPLSYPVDKCVLTSLVTATYARYSCMQSTNGEYYILKVVSSSSDCTSPSNQTRYDPTSETTGGFGTFNCDGDTSYITIDAGCDGDDEKLINIVPNVCYRNDADTLSALWTCGDSGNDNDFDNVQFATYSTTTCSGTASASNIVSFDKCKTLMTGISAKGVASESEGGCGGIIDDDTTMEPDDSANQLMIIYVALISFIAVIIMA